MHTLSWQHLKTGYSERTPFEQDQTSDSSSSLGFAIDCLNSSHLKGNLLFIDLRDRTDQRRQFQEEKKQKSDEDLLAELKRKAKDTIDAEMAQLEKKWQCSCLSAFANQCCKGLVWLLPLNAQLRFQRERTRKQITKDADKKGKKLDDKDKSQLDDEEKTVQATKVTARRNIGEKRIQEAKIEWLKDCVKTIMHIDHAQAQNDPTANPTDTLEDLEERLRAACAADAKACDTLDVCTVAFFMAVRSME